MRHIHLLFLFAALCNTPLSADDAGPSGKVVAPVCEVVAEKLEHHGVTRIDDYFWLKERSNPKVISYLEAENAYTKSQLAHTDELQATLFEEIKGRIKQTDESVPYRKRDYVYYSRTEEGKDYSIYCRRKAESDGAEQVMLDVNELARGHDYFSVRGQAVSSDQDILAFAVDTVGRRKYTIRFKNLTTGEILADEIRDVTGNMAWANDNTTLFYARQHPTTLRSYQIYRHRLGANPNDDRLVYEEQDETFRTSVFKTRSEEYLMIGSSQTLSSEYRYLRADQPDGEFTVFCPRRRDHEYQLDHLGEHFYIRTNDQARNFRLMRCPIDQTEESDWEVVVPHRADVFLQDSVLFRDYLVVQQRRDGLVQIAIRPWSGQGAHYLDFGEPAYVASASTNPDVNSTTFRFSYSSMTTPNSIYDYDMTSREKTLLKQDEVLGGFQSEHYKTERLWATARDGTKVPVSLVYRKDLRRQSGNPLLLYGYGSYGSSMNASFQSPRISLLDRGFVYAVAHIRGGQELGRQWYEDGKLLKKKNTFTDFIDVGEYLLREGYAAKGQLYAMGGSAGGLLIGAVVNVRPDLFHGVVAAVPFVDVVTTMLDDSIPLTTSEYDEWGNPNDPTYFEYMLSYSPYDNVEARAYPHMLVTAGLHDSQVQYWEPAKWVAKLRAVKTDQNRLLLETEMSAGHSGPTGRYERYRKTALQYAFLIDLAGVHE